MSRYKGHPVKRLAVKVSWMISCKQTFLINTMFCSTSYFFTKFGLQIRPVVQVGQIREVLIYFHTLRQCLERCLLHQNPYYMSLVI